MCDEGKTVPLGGGDAQGDGGAREPRARARRGGRGGFREAPQRQGTHHRSGAAVYKSNPVDPQRLKEQQREREQHQPASKSALFHQPLKPRMRYPGFEPLLVQTGQLVRRYVEGILTLCCPRCKQAFLDFDGCFALSCSRCSAGRVVALPLPGVSEWLHGPHRPSSVNVFYHTPC